MLVYRAALPLSSRTLNFTAGAVRRHRKATGSRRRKLTPGQEALLVLACLRKGETLDELEKAGLVTLADKGYQGSTWAKVPYKGRNKPEPQKEANRAHARLRALGERANAQLKTWRILRKLRCCPWRAGKLAKAIHVLQLREA